MKTVFVRELQEIENVSESTLGTIEELGRKTENEFNTWRKSVFFKTWNDEAGKKYRLTHRSTFFERPINPPNRSLRKYKNLNNKRMMLRMVAGLKTRKKDCWKLKLRRRRNIVAKSDSFSVSWVSPISLLQGSRSVIVVVTAWTFMPI